jgi:hypothetical protein
LQKAIGFLRYSELGSRLRSADDYEVRIPMQHGVSSNYQNSAILATLLRYLAISIAIGSFFILSRAYAASVTLAWDPSPGPGVEGYVVYYGNVSGSYSQAFDAGNSTTATLPNLTNEAIYYVVVAAYTVGAQSAPSNQISFRVSAGGAIEILTGAKDFNGGGFADLLWEYTPTGDYYIWLMHDGAHTSNIYLGRVPSPWRLAGVGDFNGDGEADVVWENTVSGECAIWLLRNGVVTGSISLGTVGPQWQIVAAADFNGDGQADLVWENAITGERAIWFLKNGVRTSSVSLGTVAPQWHIAGAADFSGDGQADLVWENTITGERAIWFLKNGVPTGTLSLGTVAPQWHIAGAADFNGDGQADLVWENMVTGECAIWLLKNGTPMGSISLGSVSTAWQIMEH